MTGPYATEIPEHRLGFAPGTARNAKPLPDFSGGHPDPDPVHSRGLFDLVMGPDAADFGAASDGNRD